MGEEEKTRVMIRVPDNLCKTIDAFAGYSHASRPDVVIDACRKFYVAICTREMTILQAVEEREVAKEVALAVYYEEMGSYIKGFRDNYEASAKKGKDNVSILVIFPSILFEQISRVIVRTKQFKNHQDFIKTALSFFFSSEIELGRHETKIEEFLKAADITDEVNKIREMIRQGEKPAQ